MHRTLKAALLVLLVGSVARAQSTPNPLEKAKEGQWVLQKTTASGFTSHIYQWVSKVDGKKITLRTQILNADGKSAMAAANDVVIDLEKKEGGSAAPAADAPKPTISDDEVEVKGKKVKCKKIEVTVNGVASTTWISDEIPVSGLVKSIATKDGAELSKFELVDFGDTGGKDKPSAAMGGPGGAAPEAGPAPEAKPAEGAEDTFAVGDDVAAKWVNPKDKKEYWFAAKVLKVADKVAVEYGDGELGKLEKGDVRRALKADELKAGARVLAQWNDKPQLYAGAVDSTEGGKIVVKWDDGSKPSEAIGGKAFKE
ncbi:MAG: hypothetical protein ACAI25_04430 [Planctomycetota bacterium]